MRTNLKIPLIGLVFLFAARWHYVKTAIACPRVDSISKQTVGTEGGAAVSILGCGFAHSSFQLNSGDPNSGNHVYLMGDWQLLKTDIVEEGESILKFASPRGPSGKYVIIIVVNGVTLTSDQCSWWICQIWLQPSYSPTVTALKPRYGPPDTIVELNGTIFTSRFTSNMDVFTVGKPQSIIRIYNGAGNCDPQYPNSDFYYGVALVPENSDTGYMRCRLGGTTIGNQNITYVVEAPYGKSIADASVYQVGRDGQPFMFQMFTAITEISPETSGASGGAKINIAGKYFKQAAPPKVYYGQQECLVLAVEDTLIQCQLPYFHELPAASRAYPGDRGGYWEEWSGLTVSTSADLATLDFTNPPSIAKHETSTTDEAQATFSLQPETTVLRMHNIFIAPWTSVIQFELPTAGTMALLGGKISENLGTLQLISGLTPNVTLQQDDQYELDFRMSVGLQTSNAQICVRIFNTSISNGQMTASSPELQSLSFTVPYAEEKQQIDHSALIGKSNDGIAETQQIRIRTSVAQFKLCIFRSCTPKMTVTTVTATQLQTYLEEQMQMKGFVVTISEQSANALVAEIIFPVGFGDVPLLEVITTPSDPWSVQVSEVQQGLAPITGIIRPTYMGYPSMLTYPVDGTIDEVRSSYMSLRQTICPQRLTNVDRKKYFFVEDFEAPGTGWRTADVPAFCGSYSLFSPYWFNLPATVDLARYPYLCFAVLGKVTQNVLFKYNAIGVKSRQDNYVYTHTTNMSYSPDKTWRFKCINVLTVIQQAAGSQYSIFQLSAFYVMPRRDYWEPDNTYYIDSIFIGSEPISNDEQDVSTWPRMPPKLFSNVTVTKLSSPGQFRLSLVAVQCANNYNLFGITGIPDSVNTLSSNVAIIRDARWPDGVQSTITRLQRAMNPPNGTISLSFMGIPLPPFPFNFVSSGIIERALETHPLLTNVKVNTRGACWDWKVNVEFTSRGGDQPLLEIFDRSDVTGDNVTVKIQEINKGYLKLCPIPGDMLAKVEKEPQVRVYLNNVPTTCASSCAHVLSEAMKPTISNVSLTGTSEYVLRITGTGFNASRPDANELHWLGSDNQTVEIIQAKTATEIQLEFYSLPQAQIKAGSQKARLLVETFGFSDAINVDLGSDEATITSITPSTSTLGGNIAVDIVGARFDPHTLRVRFGTIECPVKTANATTITCFVPETDSNGDVAVTVEQLGIVISGSATFNYDATITPVLSSAYPNTSIPLAGGVEVTVNGSNFVEGCTVSIGEVTVNNFTAKSETQLIFHAPRQARTGDYPILVWSPAGGRSISNVNLTYVLNVVNVSEQWGSWMGGKILNVDGNGFSPFTKVFLRATDDQVYTCVGPREAACETTHRSSTQIQCRLQPTKRVHKITNSDTNPNYGANYKWNPSTLVIIQGDTVQWEWTSPLTTKPISIYQVKSVLEPVPIPNGFSGQISSQGRYSKEFLVPGTYIYASGADYVMIAAIRVLPFGDCLTEVVVLDGENEAEHIQVKPPPLDAPSLTCPGPAPCTALANSSLMSSRYTFALRGCLTPTVDSFVPHNGAADTTITINAPAMANCPGMVEVRIGGAMCNLLTEAGVTNSTYLSCKIGDDNAANASLLAGAPLQLEVFHREMGYPIVVGTSDPLSRIFFFLPQISASNVVQNGSILGGGTLNIAGSGFEAGQLDHIKINLGTNKHPCKPINVASGTVTCIIELTDPNSLSSTDPLKAVIDVQVFNNWTLQWIPVNCSLAASCLYTFDLQQTPQVNLIEPREITNSSTSLHINGEKLLLNNETVADLSIAAGGVCCTQITALGDGQGITCTLNGSLPYGENSIVLINRIRGAALISNTLKLTSGIKVDSVTPSMGSFAGGTLVCLTGNGLDAPNIEVRFADNICTVSANVNKTSNKLCCLTPQSSLPLDGGSTTVVTVSGQIVGSSTSSQLTNAFTYSTDYTPQITGALVEVITKSDDSKISQVTISGTLLTAHTNESVDVTLGDALRCQVTEQTDSQVVCTTNDLQAGTYLVNLVNPGSGRASSTTQVTVALNLASVTPNSGSLLGDQTVTLAGTGFAGNLTNITICGKPCGLVRGNSVDLQCRTARSATNADALCDVVASIPGSSGAAQAVTLSNAFNYLGSLTPTVTSVQPLTGGTAGGTMVTIQGNSLSAPNGTQVQIGESECIIQSASATTIVCQTGPHLPAGKVTVNVIVGDKGRAAGNFLYYYVDRWSSPYTWNNSPPPIEGDFVVIGEAQQVMLDQDTPVLTMVLISGGTLFFDPSQDVELKAKYIVVINNGKFQIGTEAEPHPSQATVTLFGHVREKELPLFGAKVLALRNGTFDLHGMPRAVTWTRLAQTANVGSQTLVLTNPVDWQPGEKIVITSTGGRNSHGENEEHEIQSVSADNRTLTLVGTIAYRKLSLTINYTGGVSGFFSAEVGLLTRNVVIRGDSNSTVPSSVPQCPADFSTGQFATQTCYQGNPTDQMGVDQFGGHLHIGGPIVNSDAVRAHISYVEFTYMGQAFRLGRYPIHFHLNGRMNGTYVKGCSIHTAFNRAINVHNTHQVLIENNVVHDVMGGALFLEDGLEQENVIQYNLFVHVKKTSSLLTDDVVPAAYWITHPYNIVRHNVAAGGTNFGFWYRMLENPTGPSTTTTVCPRIARMGVFENNTVHSQGWFALWIHEIYYPTTDGVCGSVKWDKAVFRKLFAWNNNKGPECVNCGNVQFEDMLLVNNVEAGIEGKLLKNSNVYNQLIGPVYRNVYVVGHEESINSDEQKCNSRAVIPPWSPGLRVEDMTMRNFNGPNCTAIYGTVITCQCILLCGGYEYRMKNITWENTDNRAEFRWASDFVLRDEDSSLVAGISGLDPMNGALIMPYAPHLPTEKCGPTAPGAGDLGTAYGQGAVRGVRCQPEVTAIRYSVDVLLPTQAVGSDMLVTILGGGTQTVPFKKDGLTEKKGWMTTLVNNYTFEVGWRSQPSFTNLSYVAHVENFRDNDYVIVRHVGFDRKPDRVQILLGGAETVASTVPLDPVLNESGAHYYNETGKYLEYLLKCPPHPALFVSTQLKFTAYVCFYPNCTSPEEVRSGGSLTRPANAVFWSNASTWTGSLGPVPTNGSSLTIPSSTWLVLDTSITIRLVTIVIEGSLEIISGTADHQKVYDISFNQMVLKGGRLLAGITPETPLTNANLTLTLLGSINDSDAFSDMSGPTIGPKSIANYGQMLMHADRKIPTWTRLARTAAVGSNQLVLETPVNNWKVGERIAVATTSKDYLQCETRTIHSISDDNLTIKLVDQLQYTHLAYNEVYGKYEFKTGAEVAILSSNIVIQGDETSDASKFGGRILVSGSLIGTDFVLGQLKLSGVHLKNMGQSTFLAVTDARLPVAFLNAGDLIGSYLNSTIFENSYSTAIGAYGTNGLIVTDSVIYNTTGSGIALSGSGHRLIRNAIIRTGWSGEMATGEALSSPDIVFQAGVDIFNAPDTVLQDIAVAGAERIGLMTKGFSCTDNVDQYWQRVVVHSCMVGILITDVSSNCTTIANVKVYSATEFSVYFHVTSSIIGTNMQLVDNRGGIYTYVGTPNGRSGEMHGKTVQLQNSLLVGHSGLQLCTDAPRPEVIKISPGLKGIYSPTGGHLGMVSSQFLSAMSNIVTMALVDWTSEFSLGGGSFIRNITVAKYGNICPGIPDAFWRTDTANEDGIQPTYFESVTVIDVDTNYITYYDQPKQKNINFEKCGDMECDGYKKVLIMDKDGTLFGQPTTILPRSEWQWGKDPSYGVGNSKVPIRMTSRPDGTKVAVDTQWPQKGVIRDKSCQYVDTMQAYKCGNALDHRVLLIESLDEDRILRRIAPVAFATDGLETNYLDLINGPADHGRCSSYTCMKRLSAFFAFVARGKNFLCYFTGTPPQKIRLSIFQPDATYAVRVGIDYSVAGRLDVYENGVYVFPKNGAYNDKNQMIFNAPTTTGQYMPKPESDPSGTNYFDTKTETLYVVIKGLSVVEIRYQPLIIISFGIPAMTEADFYGSNVVDNMAKFLGIPSSRIRIAKIVSESSGGSRRRRAAATLNVQLEISEPPSATAQPINTSLPAAQSTVQTQPTLLETVSAKLVNSVQTNGLSSALNTTISGVQLVEPPPQPGSERWQVLASSTSGVSSTPQVIQIPYSAEISVNATVVEGEPFTILLSTSDAGNTHVSKLGTGTDPWKYSLFGSQTVAGFASVNNAPFSSTNNGYTILEKAYVNSTGTHQLSVTIADPSSTTVLNKSITFTVTARKFDLKASLIGQEEQNNGTSGKTTILLQFRVQMFDKSTGRNSESLDWRGFTWKLVAGLCSDTGSPSFVGSTVSSVLADYHWNTSVPKTNDKYTFCFNLNAYQSNESDTVVSEYTPPPYSLDYQTSSGTTQANYVKLVRLTFPGTLASISAVIDKFKEAVKTKVLALCPSVTISDITLSEGSILTDVTMNSNSESSLITASQTVQDSVNAGTMTIVVDGIQFTATNTVTTTNPTSTGNRGKHIHWAFGLNILNLVRWVLI